MDISRANQERHKWQRIDTWAAQRFSSADSWANMGKLHHYPILHDFTVSRVWETSPESLSGKSFRKCWICFGLTYHPQFVSRGNRDNIVHLTFAENVVFPHVATVCCSFPALPYISCLQVSDALWEWAGGPLAMALSGRPRPMPFCAVVF